MVLAVVGIMGATSSDNSNSYYWVVALAIELAIVFFSFGTLKVGQVGAMFLLEDPYINELGYGLYFAPLGLFNVKKEKGTIFQDELPADPEKIFRDSGTLPEGMFPPIRIKFGQPNPADVDLSDDPYNIAMVAEVVPVISWHITSLVRFLEVLKDVENCRKIMADKAVELFGIAFANVTPAKATLGLATTSQQLKNKLREEMVNCGIEINDCYVKPFIFSHELNASVVSVSVERENAKGVILKAIGEKTKRIEEATGAAEAVKLAAGAEKFRLVETGLAKTGRGGKIIELVPDANIRVNADAIGKLSETKGTVVLGNSVTPVVTTKKEGE